FNLLFLYNTCKSFIHHFSFKKFPITHLMTGQEWRRPHVQQNLDRFIVRFMNQNHTSTYRKPLPEDQQKLMTSGILCITAYM
uniref:Uncharacterized protein n=1 Tax=Salvator merianae TaxID=96440 RepID=A0A8D0E301_SALMN